MKAGDRSGAQLSSRESWLSAPLSDPNAALWASITPPANPNLATIVRRRAASFSLDLLAQRLYLRFPATFSSRATARIAILSASVAAGAAFGVAGYKALFPRAASPIAAHATATAPPGVTGDAAPTRPRHGQTELGAAASNSAVSNSGARFAAPTLAATARPTEPEQLVQRLQPSADATEESSAAPAQAKRSVAKKRGKVTARRASKRRARAAND